MYFFNNTNWLQIEQIIFQFPIQKYRLIHKPSLLLPSIHHIQTQQQQIRYTNIQYHISTKIYYHHNFQISTYTNTLSISHQLQLSITTITKYNQYCISMNIIDRLNTQNTPQQQITIQHINPIVAETQENIHPAQCRICLEQGGNLVQPCFCDGSIAWVHQDCIKLYASKKLQNYITKQPRHIKYRCQLCRSQIYFQHDIKLKLNCNPWAEGKRFKTWLVLLILLVVFSLLETLLLIMIIVHYNRLTSSVLFAEDKIWIVITVTPLLALGLFLLGFYFICQNLYGIIRIVKATTKGKKPDFLGEEGTCISVIGYILSDDLRVK